MNKLKDVIISAIEDKKAKNIVYIDMSGVDGAVADGFVICNADSTTQVAAIADGVEEAVLRELDEKPRRIEGMNNALWVVVDYVDIMVHIFETEMRGFYKLEDLWADLPSTKYGGGGE